MLGPSFSEGWKSELRWALVRAAADQWLRDGWPAGGGCRVVAYEFAPQRGVRAGYVISGLACVVLLAVLPWRGCERSARS
jgi:hypothetical protein